MKRIYIAFFVCLCAYSNAYTQNSFPVPTGETTINAGNAINIFSENNTIGVKLFGTGNGFSPNSGPGYLQLHGSYLYDNGNNLHIANGGAITNIHGGDMNAPVNIQLNAVGNSYFNSGFLGIGTNGPNSRLRVIGGGTVLGNNAVVNNTDGHLSIGDVNANSSPTNQNWGERTTFLLSAQDYSTIGFHDSGQRVDFIRAGGGTIQLGYDGGWGQANIGLPGGLWNSAGNVSIGTTDSHGYKLAVNGNIRAKEIKVETGWADYVFDKDYKLRSLKETQDYIRQYHHLPEVPSATEVKENGINLGEMNALLLKKVEELTLYLLEQHKQINAQQQTNQKLHNRLRTLENQQGKTGKK
jgi:hypothetical protein